MFPRPGASRARLAERRGEDPFQNETACGNGDRQPGERRAQLDHDLHISLPPAIEARDMPGRFPRKWADRKI